MATRYLMSHLERMKMLTNSEAGITVANVQAELAAEIKGHRLRKRRLNALLAVLKAEAAGQRLLPGVEEKATATAAKEKP